MKFDWECKWRKVLIIDFVSITRRNKSKDPDSCTPKSGASVISVVKENNMNKLNEEEIKNKMLNFYFKFDTIEFNKCLEPSLTCKNTAIKAHSVQNSKILENLIDNGHVCTFTHKLMPPKIELGLLGRNEATTFTGLCSTHDNELFSAIDKDRIDIKNNEHLFLLAYRAIYKGLHATLDAALKIQIAYLKQIDLGIDPGDKQTNACAWATERIMTSYQTCLYKTQFDNILLNKNYDLLCHNTFIINLKEPTIAVCSLFTIDEFIVDNDIIRIALNVLPVSKTNTYIIFSYLKQHATAAQAVLDKILNSTGSYQLYEISRLILNYCENFVLSPTYVKSWSSSKKNIITKFFQDTILKKNYDSHSPDLYLF